MPVPKANINYRQVRGGRLSGDTNKMFYSIPKDKWDRIFNNNKEDTGGCQGNADRDTVKSK